MFLISTKQRPKGPERVTKMAKQAKNTKKFASPWELQKDIIERESAARPRPVGENDAGTITSAVLPKAEDGSVELSALANLDEAALLEDNARSVDFLIAELEKAATIVKARENLPKAKEILRKLVSANEQKGIFVDTPAVAELKERIAVADAVNIRSEVDGDAMVLFNFRKLYSEIQDAADETRDLGKKLKTGISSSEVENAMDELVNKYYRFINQLRKDRRICEVPGRKLEDWSRRRVSFTDEAFAAKNHEGQRFWFWGILGDEKSMALAKAMRYLFINLDRIMRQLNEKKPKTETPAPTEQPVQSADSPAPTE